MDIRSFTHKCLRCFLSVVFTYLFLFNVFIANAQSNTNIEGTTWLWKSLPNLYPTADNSTMVSNIFYIFDQNGKLKILTRTEKFGGATPTLIFNQALGQMEYQYNPAIPVTDSKILEARYSTQGKNVTIEFRDATINATVVGNQIRGFVYSKSNGQKQEFTLTKVLIVNNSSSVKPNSDQNTDRNTQGNSRFGIGNNSLVQSGEIDNDFSTAMKLPELQKPKKIFYGRKSSYPNVIVNSNGKYSPAGCYTWMNVKAENDFRVKEIEGISIFTREKNLPPNYPIDEFVNKLIDTCTPSNGYVWVNPDDPTDFQVKKY